MMDSAAPNPIDRMAEIKAQIDALDSEYEMLREQVLDGEASMADLRAMSIDDLAMSMRLRSRLVAANIVTVGALLDCSDSDLMQLQRFGKASLAEVRAVLRPLRR